MGILPYAIVTESTALACTPQLLCFNMATIWQHNHGKVLTQILAMHVYLCVQVCGDGYR